MVLFVAGNSLNDTVEKGFPDPVTWHPYALKPVFLCLVSTLALVLCLTVTLLSWISGRNYGLGNDDGASAILFGWRFTPSLVAVLYVQLTSMVLDAVKSTEPISRLARPGGSSASSSVLQRPGAWWNALVDGFSKSKNSGRRSWLLVSAALLNVIGFFGISPFSSALFLSKDVPVSTDVEFSRMSLPENLSLPLQAGRETYLRTIGHVLQNVSTSAWISDEYTVLPFWPSEIRNAPLGPFLSASSQTWQAETLVLQTTMDCMSMSLAKTKYTNTTYNLTNLDDEPMGPFPNETATITLEAEDGCAYSLSLAPTKPMVTQGGSSWSDSSLFIYGGGSVYGAEAGVYGPNTFTPDYGHVDSSPECRHRELILTTTSWNSSAEDFSFSPDLRVSGTLCAPRYHMAQIMVKASMTDAISEVNFDKDEFERKKAPIPDTALDLEGFRNLTLTGNWTTYFATPEGQARPTTGGLSTVLAAMYGFDISAMLDADAIVPNATSIKQRFFGEVLQYSLGKDDTAPKAIEGRITKIQKRVIVQTEASIVLAILLLISLCLSLWIWRASNLVSRPLNLSLNPATAVGIAALVTSNDSIRANLRDHGLSSRKQLENLLEKKRYQTSPGALHELTQSHIVASSKSQEPPDSPS